MSAVIPERYALRVQGISKAYQLGATEKQAATLRGQCKAVVGKSLRNLRYLKSVGSVAAESEAENVLWALRDVNLEIEKGEVVGLIGRNGAGKSTLLKVLARITYPTSGRAEVRGRLGSLLEVGTGFHPELTGRENVYLNGAILGMRRQEITAAFDSIVEFSGVERFLDTPVKRYSSGMRVRLAFAVAAHLEPEILLIDEVLAVGDAAFQKKCLRRMEEVGQYGRTVIFVSHNMSSVARLCTRTVAMDGGTVVADGPSAQVIEQYTQSMIHMGAERHWKLGEDAPGNHWACLVSMQVVNALGVVSASVEITDPVVVVMEYEVLEGEQVLAPSIQIRNAQEVLVFISIDVEESWRGRPKPPGRYRSRVTIPGNLLAEGAFFVTGVLSTIEPVHVCFYERDTIMFHVIDSGLEGSARGGFAETIRGIVRPKLEWATEQL